MSGLVSAYNLRLGFSTSQIKNISISGFPFEPKSKQHQVKRTSIQVPTMLEILQTGNAPKASVLARAVAETITHSNYTSCKVLPET